MRSGHHVLQRGRFCKPNFILRGCFIRAFCFVFRKIKVRVPRRVELRYKEVKFSFFSGFFRLKSLLRGHFPVNNEAKRAFIVVCTRVNKLKIVFEKWVFKDCLDTWPPRRVKKTFIKRESSHFVEDVEILLIKIQMTDTILKPAAKFAKEILEIDNLDIASDIIHSFIHHFCAVAVLQKYKGLKKVRRKIIQSFPVIKVNIAFLKHIMNIL